MRQMPPFVFSTTISIQRPVTLIKTSITLGCGCCDRYIGTFVHTSFRRRDTRDVYCGVLLRVVFDPSDRTWGTISAFQPISY